MGITPIGKENVLPNKRVRKALAPAWTNPQQDQQQLDCSEMSFAIETPVIRNITKKLTSADINEMFFLLKSKSLGDDALALFSTPSSIMKDSLGVASLMELTNSNPAKVHGWFHFGDIFPSQ